MKSLPAKLWVLAVLAALAYFIFIAEHEKIDTVIKVLAGCLALTLLWPCFAIVNCDEDGERGALITLFGSHWRSVGSGPVILFQPFGIPVERIKAIYKLEMSVVDDRVTYPTRDNQAISLEFTVRYWPIPHLLWECVRNQDLMEVRIKSEIKSLIAYEIRKQQTRSDVKTQLPAIADTITKEFHREYSRELGVTILIHLATPSIPLELAEG